MHLYVGIGEKESKAHLAILYTYCPWSACNWFMMFSLMCTERGGNQTSAFKETNANP